MVQSFDVWGLGWLFQIIGYGFCWMFFDKCNPGNGLLRYGGKCRTPWYLDNMAANTLTSVDMSQNTGMWYVQSHTTHYPGWGEDACTRIKVEADPEETTDSGTTAYKVTSYMNPKKIDNTIGPLLNDLLGDLAFPIWMYDMDANGLQWYIKNYWTQTAPTEGAEQFISSDNRDWKGMKRKPNFFVVQNDP